MREPPRRTFLRKAAIVSAAAGTAAGISGDAAGQSDKKNEVVLYHETSDWKRYYETLK